MCVCVRAQPRPPLNEMSAELNALLKSSGKLKASREENLLKVFVVPR